MEAKGEEFESRVPHVPLLHVGSWVLPSVAQPSWLCTGANRIREFVAASDQSHKLKWGG
jgi:hypothetical protein